jgi:hypothetical protein
MKKYLTTLLTVAMFGWAGYASAQATKPAYLTNAQLKALLSDTITVRVTGWYNRSGTGVFQKDGTARLDAAAGVMVGSWKIEGNKICTNYTSVGPGCQYLEKTGATTYRVVPDNGDPAGTFEMVPKRK